MAPTGAFGCTIERERGRRRRHPEILIRVNSADVELSQADFAMSKIAVNEAYGGHLLRKAIDYFCHLSLAPDFLRHIEKNDKGFAASEFFPKMRWLRNTNDSIYNPTYTDMLRSHSRPNSGAASYRISLHYFPVGTSKRNNLRNRSLRSRSGISEAVSTPSSIRRISKELP